MSINEAMAVISSILLVVAGVMYVSGIILKDRPIELPQGVSRDSMDQVIRERKGY